MNVIITNRLSIKKSDFINKEFKKYLLNELTRANPEVGQKQAMGFSVRGITANLHMYREKGDYIQIDRGCWDTLYDVAKYFKVPLVRVDNRTCIPGNIPDFNGTLDAFQEEAVTKVFVGASIAKVKEWVKNGNPPIHTQGILSFPTGGGKTVTCLYILSILKQRTCIVLHTCKLATQWEKAINKYLPGAKVGRKYGGQDTCEGADIVIAITDTLESKGDKEFYSSFGCVVLDEAHHVGAKTFQNVMGQFTSRYRYGLTASLRRRDGKGFYIKSIFGKILVKLDYDDVGERIILPNIYPISTSLSEDYSDIYKPVYSPAEGEPDIRVDYTWLYTKLVNDKSRNTLILQLLGNLLKDPETYVLVLSKRREHAELMTKFLKTRGIPAEVILGGGTKKEKAHSEDAIERTIKGENRVLVGTSVADEGLDVVNLNELILTCPTSWTETVKQRIGRIARNHPGKKIPRVWDLVDGDIPELWDAWGSREKFYKRNKMEIDYAQLKEREDDV